MAALKGAPSEHKGAQGSNTGAIESMQGYAHADALSRRAAASRSLNWPLSARL